MIVFTVAPEATSHTDLCDNHRCKVVIHNTPRVLWGGRLLQYLDFGLDSWTDAMVDDNQFSDCSVHIAVAVLYNVSRIRKQGHYLFYALNNNYCDTVATGNENSLAFPM